ncbi:Jumping translocation breakpoint protein (JTB) [Plasmodiophora brassicae]
MRRRWSWWCAAPLVLASCMVAAGSNVSAAACSTFAPVGTCEPCRAGEVGQAHCPSSESYRQAFQCPDMSLFFLPCVPVEDPRSFWAFQMLCAVLLAASAYFVYTRRRHVRAGYRRVQ